MAARPSRARQDPGPAASPPGRRDRWAATALALVALLVYNANLRCIAQGDSFPARFLPLALLHTGTLYLDSVAEAARMGWPRSFWIVPTRGDGRHPASLYPVATPLLVAPLFLPTALYLDRRGWGDVVTVQARQASWISEKPSLPPWSPRPEPGLMYWLAAAPAGPAARICCWLPHSPSVYRADLRAISSQALWQQHGMAELLATVALASP